MLSLATLWLGGGGESVAESSPRVKVVTLNPRLEGEDRCSCLVFLGF
jgi:hypothetical protein